MNYNYGIILAKWSSWSAWTSCVETSPDNFAHSRSRSCVGGEIGAHECPPDGATQDAPCDQTCAQQAVPRKVYETPKADSSGILVLMNAFLMIILAVL